jgi:hypothetical protein
MSTVPIMPILTPEQIQQFQQYQQLQNPQVPATIQATQYQAPTQNTMPPTPLLPDPSTIQLQNLQNTSNVKVLAQLVDMDKEFSTRDFAEKLKTYSRDNKLTELYQVLKDMNLMDEENLDDIYLNSPGFVEPTYLYHTLLSLYSSKYPKVFENNSLNNHLSLILAVLVFHGLEKLKSYLSPVTEQSVNLVGKFQIATKRKRAINEPEPEKKQKTESFHPTMLLSHIQAKPILLKIGDLLSIATPSTLVPLRTKIQFTTVRRQLRDNQTINVSGLEVNIDPPTLVLIDTKEVGSNKFFECSKINLDEILKDLGFTMYNNWLNYGVKRNLIEIDINRREGTSKYEFVGVNNFSVVVNSRNELSARCYSNHKMIVYDDSMILDKALKESLERSIEKKNEELEAILEEYSKSKTT